MTGTTPNDLSKVATRFDGVDIDGALAASRLALAVLVAVMVSRADAPSSLASSVVIGVAVLSVAMEMHRRWSSTAREPRLRPFRIFVDVILALAAMVVVDAVATPLVWIALLVPMVGAAVHSGRAALIVWVASSTAYIAVLVLDPETGASSFSLGLQQLLAAFAFGSPLIAWSARIGDTLEVAAASRRDAISRAMAMRTAGSQSRAMSAATSESEVDTALVALGEGVGASHTELWFLDDERPLLLSARGSGLAAASGLGLVRSRSGTEATATLHDGDAVRSCGPAACVVAAIPERSQVVRYWFHDEASAWWGIDAIEIAVGSARNAADQLDRVAALESWSETLAERANTDHLTGLYNRVGLEEAIDASPNQVQGVLYLDLDGFKAVNDTHGHETGDDVLVVVAKRFQAVVGEGELLARMGGDEFVVVVTGEPTSADDITRRLEAAAEELRAAVADEIVLGSRSVRLGVSVGTATFTQGQSLRALLREADVAMYELKRTSASKPAPAPSTA